jgi:hypothetical protein
LRTATLLSWSFSVAALLAFAHSPAARAQEPEQPVLVAPFGAEILVSEVLLDVMVTDKKGNPILGLGPDDFVVTEDDRKVKVTGAAFYSNRRYAGPEAAPAGPADAAGAMALANTAGLAPHYFIFLFDDQRRNSADVPGLLQRQVRAGKDAIAWLREGLAPTDWVAVAGYEALPGFLAGPRGARARHPERNDRPERAREFPVPPGCLRSRGPGARTPPAGR